MRCSMARCVLPPKLEGVGKGFFVCPHEAGQLLYKKGDSLVSLFRLLDRNYDQLTLTKNSPSSESMLNFLKGRNA